MKKRLFSIITALTLCLTLLPATALAATNVTYYDWNSSTKKLEAKTCSSATEVTSGDTSWGTAGNTTWYVVNSNVTIGETGTEKTVTVNGNVHLILADGCSLTIKGNIQVMKDVGTLTIYGQSAGTGELNVENSSSKSSSSYYDAAIGGQRLEKSMSEAGSITINGGTINAFSNGYGAAIGASGRKNSGEYGTATVTINGGTVTATANSGSAVIGGGSCSIDYYGTATVTINGGTINATSYYAGAAIGGGQWCTGNVTINGGDITAAVTSGGGAAIGGGRSSPCNVIISGGKINATASDGAAIGSGYAGASATSPIEINGGEIYAKASSGAAIGGGSEAILPVNVTINGGKIEAHGASGAGIGTGYGYGAGSWVSDTSSVTITGGEINADADTGAGIGSGSKADNAIAKNSVNVSISGGTVTARTNYVSNTDCGAAIGGGGGSPQGSITISGGTVKAYGTRYAPGIGNAPGGTAKGTIKISGGNVTAEGGLQAAGIGSGNYTKAGNIEISGGTVKATGGNMGAGIGTGAGQTATTYLGKVSIKGGTVNATGGNWAAGIGGGHYVGGGGSITISGGTVTATRGDQSAMTTPAADIGHGGDATSSGITFTLNGTAWTYVNNEGQYTTPTKTAGFYFLGKNGTVYGSQTLPSVYCIASDESLTVPEGASLNTGGYNLYVKGTLSGAERVTGSVYCPLTLTDCTVAGLIDDYGGTRYGKAGTSFSLVPYNKTGYVFDSWTTTPSVSISGNTFTMPYRALSVKATYKLAVTITAQPQNQNITYGSDVQLSVSAQNSSGRTDGITYRWYKNGAALTGETSNTLTLTKPNAGTYQYYCAVTYGGSTVNSNTVTVTVNKAAPALTDPTANTLVYNGSAQELVTAGTTADGEVQYALSEGGPYSAAIPTGTNAGSYTVWYQVAGDSNHNDSTPASVQVTIDKLAVTVSGITANGKTYDGTLVANLVCDNAVFAGKLKGDTLSVTATGTFTDENAADGKTVNITNLTLGGSSADNYTLAAEGQQISATANISPKPVTVTIDSKSSAYGAAIVELTATDNGIVTGDTDVYTLSTTATSSSPAGSYDITGKGKSANYNFTFENGTNAYTIVPGDLNDAAVSLTGWTYGDEPNTPVVTGNVENANVTYQYKEKDAEDSTYSDAVPTGAGVYTVKATIAASANYNGKVVAGDFNINPKALTVTGLTATNRDYDGTKDVTLTGGVLDGIVSGDENDVSATMPTTGTIASADAGENKPVTFDIITLTGGKAGNYTLTQPTVTVNIGKISSTLEHAPTGKEDLVYDGKAHELVNAAGTAVGGTVQYSLDKQTWSADIPTGINAGNYTVWYKVVGGSNYNDTESQSISVTIAQAEVYEPTLNGSYTYNGQDQTVDLTGYDSSYMQITGDTEKNAGNYTATITLNANYKWAAGGDGSLEWSIAPKPVTVTIDSKSSVYSTTIVELTATDNGIVTGDTDVYTLSTTATSSSDVGSYDITGTSNSSNYTFTFNNGSGAYTITRADNSWMTEPSVENRIYGEIAKDPTYKAKFGNETVKVEYRSASSTNEDDYTTQAPTDAGSYKVRFFVAETANYTGLSVEKDLTVSKGTYGATTVVGSAKYGNTGTVDLSNYLAFGGSFGEVNKTDADSVLSGNPVIEGNTLKFAFADNAANVNKTATITVPVNGATNYNDYTITMTVTVIAKTAPSVTAPTANTGLIYDGTAQELISAGSTNAGEMQYSLTSGSGYSTEIPTATNADTYTVYYRVVGDSEYADVAENSFTVTIDKKKVTATPKDITITKGSAIPAFELTYTGLVGSDTVTPDADLTFTCFEADGATAVNASTVAGTYTITWANTEIAFTGAENYQIVAETGTLTINNRRSSRDSSYGDSLTPTYPPAVTQPDAGGSVTVSSENPKTGDKVTITPKPEDGYTVEQIILTDKNGDPIKVTDNGDGTYSFTQPAGKVNVKVTFMEDNTMLNFFVDVPANAYYYDAVLWAAKNGITGGTSATTFSPNAPCTRAQIVTFLWRAAGSPEPKSLSSFSDVPADVYYAKAVAWALENGITTGTGNGTFSPDATCTRAQAMTFIYRSEQAQGGGMQGEWMFQNPFSDVNLESYYGEAVMWAVANDITTGTSATTFSPDEDCTRAQIVTFLYRYLNK